MPRSLAEPVLSPRPRATVIAKLTTPWTSGSGLRSTSVVGSQEELIAQLRHVRAGGAGLMLQEFIPGGREHDWFFHGYCDADSALPAGFTGIKEPVLPGRTPD